MKDVQEQYRMSDEVVSQIARLLQMAILSGTDVVDHLRMIRVSHSEENPGCLSLSDEYRDIAESQISKMLERVEDLTPTDLDS